MESLNLGQYQPYLLILIGLIAMVAPLFSTPKTKDLEKTGERCEGIIFKLDYSSDTFNDSSVKDKITVRFVTKDLQWITEDLNSDFILSYTGQYKEGEKVSVIYNADNPTEFMVETKQSQVKVKLMFFFVGLIFVGGGVYELFK